MIRLLLAIRKQGVDIEKIYNEEVKGVYDQSTDESTIPTFEKNKARKSDNQDLNLHIESRYEAEESHRSESSGKVIRNLSYLLVPEVDFNGRGSLPRSQDEKTSGDSTQFQINATSFQPKQQNINPLLKTQLKLDLTNVKSTKPTQQLNLNLPLTKEEGETENKDEGPLGFHDEFMARIDEFSLSWRQAAMAERKF